MIKHTIILLVALLVLNASEGQRVANRVEASPPAQSFYLAIHINSDLPLNDSLTITFSRNQTFSRALYDGGYYLFPLNSNSPFETRINDVHDIGRLTLYSREISNSYLPVNQMVEPGDSIKIEILLSEDGTSSIKFSGRGSSKYVLGKMTEGITLAKKDLELQAALGKKKTIQVIKQYDSLLIEHVKLLNAFRKKISPQVYEVWKADAIAETRNQQFRILSLAYSTADSPNKENWKREIDKLLSKTKVKLRAQNIGLSRNFIEWEYEKTKWALVYERNKNYKPWEFTGNNDSLEFIDLYKKLRKNYSGSLRENLLAYSLLSTSDIYLFFDGCLPDDFTWCLNDAARLIQSPNLKQRVEEKLRRFGRGAPAFNFELFSEAGQRIHLSDFKSKTVLIEIWSNGCTACIDFIKEFERKIYPDIKDRDDLKMMTISIETDHNKWFSSLKKHSRPGFVNLYTEKGISDPLMIHYEISYTPFVLLIDSKGKIISSTVRNCDQLNMLIKEIVKTK